MQKKEIKAEGSKESNRHNWTSILVILLIFTIIAVIFNNGFLVTGNAVRAAKKADLVPSSSGAYATDIQYLNYWDYTDNKLSATIQAGASVLNIGTARAGKSSLVLGVKGATTDYAISTAFKVDPLMPNIGSAFATIFVKIPIGTPPADGTPIEQEYILYSIADAGLSVSESNESNNILERRFIFHCANYTSPKCCVKPLGEWPTQFTPTIDVECPE